jgi:catechol 2,3-dioxygenase
MSATAIESGPDQVQLYAAQTPLHMGKVTLVVRDLPLVAAFYRTVIGLAVIAEQPGSIDLGAGGKVLLGLVEDRAAAPSSPRSAGLFHTAFLVPTRRDLARWLLHVADVGATIQGASDHLVSEAIYLADPEGNGIEVYRDRDPGAWRWDGDTVAMATDHLDMNDLVAGTHREPWAGMPAGTCVGHVHLRVGDIPAAERFYRDALGLDLTARYPGGSFYASGRYHHHIATNVWQSRGAGPRPRPSTGLRSFEILARDPESWAAVTPRALAAGAREEGDGSLVLDDPWNNALVLRMA